MEASLGFDKAFKNNNMCRLKKSVIWVKAISWSVVWGIC